MASWQDGPEYAPSERPAAFVASGAAPLPDAAPPPAMPAAIAEEPHFVPPQVPSPALAALVPAAAPGRNPHLPFEVLTTPITTGSVPAAHPPTQPFAAPGPSLTGYLPVQPTVQPAAQINPAPFPSPGTPQWFAPAPQTRVPDAPKQVTVSQIWQGVTPGVLIPLFIGMFFTALAPFMLLIGFVLSSRIGYRRAAVQRTWQLAGVVVAASAFYTAMQEGPDPEVVYDALGSTSLVLCWVVVVVLALIVASALRAGEKPFRIR